MVLQVRRKELYMILDGSFSVSFPGGEYTLQSGDAPGICELYTGSHVATCRKDLLYFSQIYGTIQYV